MIRVFAKAFDQDAIYGDIFSESKINKYAA